MSDPSNLPESESTSNEPQERARKTAGNTRLKILLLVMAVLGVAILYDYFVARAGVNTAYDRVNELSSDNAIGSGGRVLTKQDIQAVLNREPTETFTEHGYEVDVFRWMSGVPSRNYDYFVVYAPRGASLNFVTHFKYASRPDVLKELDPNKFGGSSLPRSEDEWREHFGEEAAAEYLKNAAELKRARSTGDGRASEPVNEN